MTPAACGAFVPEGRRTYTRETTPLHTQKEKDTPPASSLLLLLSLLWLNTNLLMEGSKLDKKKHRNKTCHTTHPKSIDCVYTPTKTQGRWRRTRSREGKPSPKVSLLMKKILKRVWFVSGSLHGERREENTPRRSNSPSAVCWLYG